MIKGLSEIVGSVLGTDLYVIENAVADYGPQSPIVIPPDPVPDSWRLVRATWGGYSESDVRNGRMRETPNPPGQPREERVIAVQASALRSRPSSRDRIVEKATGKNWQIVHVKDRYDGNETAHYAITVRDPQKN